MAFYGKTNGEWQKFSKINTYKQRSLAVCNKDGNVYRINEIQNQQGFNVFNDAANAMEIDSDSNAYVVSSDGTFKKINIQTGSVIEELVFGSNFISVALDPTEQYVYVGTEGGEVIKVSSDSFSSQEWQVNVGNNVNGLGAGYGNVYATAFTEVVNLDRNGNEKWRVQGDNTGVNDVEVGQDGQVYESTRDQALRKISSNGNVVWTFGGFNGVVQDAAINETTGDIYGISGTNIRKVNNNGDQVFEYTPLTLSINTISIDAVGDIYVGQENGDVKKFEDTGNTLSEQWSIDVSNTGISGSDVKLIT